MTGRRSRVVITVLMAFSLVSTGMVTALEPITSWYWQNPLPQGHDLLDMAFEPGGAVGWAVGSSGVLLRTDSQGAIWTRAEAPFGTATLYSVAAPAMDHVWVVAENSVYCSSDGGETWSAVPIAYAPRTIAFRDPLAGWCGTADGTILRTIDGGLTWAVGTTPFKPVNQGDPRTVRDILTASAVPVALVGDDIWSTVDGGGTWTVSRDASDWAPQVAFASSQVGIAVIGWDCVRTTDGGRTWSGPIDIVGHAGGTPVEMRLSGPWFATPTTGYVLTTENWVYRTTDAGLSWARYVPAFLDRYGETSRALPEVTASVKVGDRRLFCGRSGSISFTGDSGASYQNVTSDMNDDIRAASFDTTLTGIGVGYGAAVFTADGGGSWNRFAYGFAFDGYAACLAPNGSGWAVGDDTISAAKIVRIRRTGGTFEARPQSLPVATKPYTRLQAVWTNDGVSGWAVGTGGWADGPTYVYKTTDSGATWRAVSVPAAPTDGQGRPWLNDIQVLPSGVGWMSGVALMRTTDGGETWVDQTASCPVSWSDIWVENDSTCYVAGRTKEYPGYDAVAVTRDSGATWMTSALRESNDGIECDIRFTDSQHGYVLAKEHYSARIYSTADGGATWECVEPWAGAVASLASSQGSVWALGGGGVVLFNGGEGGDLEPPQVRSNAPSGWSLGDATVYLAGVDQCGVSDLQWRFDTAGVPGDSVGILSETPTEYQRYTGPIKVSAEGRSRIVSFARDVNGNQGSESYLDVQVDKSAPTTLAEIRGPHSMSPSIALTSSDTGAGVRNTYSSLDGAAVKLYGAPFAVPRQGWHRLEYWSTDYAGRSESRRVVEFAQDGRAAHLVIAGSDRFATSARMSQRAFPDGASSVVLATGRNWPDALGGASLAGAVDAPVLLVDKNAVPAVVMDEIRRLGVDRVFILGGTAAIGPVVETLLVSEFGRPAVERIAGATRYATAEHIAARVVLEQGAAWDGTCLLATGANFPDALAASPLAASQGWPLLLSEKASLTDIAQSRIIAMGASTVVVLGGSGALSPMVESQVRSIPGVTRVPRLSGADRYETAVHVARYGRDNAGLAWNGLALATGMNYPDALSGGVAQGRLGSVVLLTRPTALSTATQVCLQGERAQITDIVYLGGQAAIGVPVRSSVQAILR